MKFLTASPISVVLSKYRRKVSLYLLPLYSKKKILFFFSPQLIRTVQGPLEKSVWGRITFGGRAKEFKH